MEIRTARQEDVGALLDIYNYEVENGIATFDLQPKTLSAWQDWFARHNVENHPLIVAVEDGVVAGYASLSPYREKEAYRSTVELSVYIHPQFRGRGIGSALMEAILMMARSDPRTHKVISVITGSNQTSVYLHEKFGFTFCGTMHEVGVKFGHYLDIVNYELSV